MANQIEMFYSSFSGTDTRSNKLLQDPKSFRHGSKNFRYNFKDEIQNREGFQHKDSGAPSFVDIFEYKCRDVNTGAAVTEILGVATDGHLYRKRTHSLRFASHTGYTSVSVYFDDVANTFKIVLNGATPASVSISDTMTLAQLETALDAIPGVSVSIVDDTGATVATSTQLAYLLDCVINDSTFADNAVYYWQRIPFPDITCVSVSSVTEANLDMSNASQFTYNSVPFKTTLKAQTDAIVAASYEGISTINLYNSIYITDGGFPMKYDGKCVYRAGLPKQIQGVLYPTRTGMSYNGVAAPSGISALAAGKYLYKARFGFTDYRGSTIYGDIIEQYSLIAAPPLGAGSVYQVITKGIFYGPDFPTFSAKVNGTQSVGTSGNGITLNVFSGHNILPGMIVRQSTVFTAADTAYSTSNSFINFYARVTAVTATTVTLEKTVKTDTPTFHSNFLADSIIQAYYVEDSLENLRPPSNYTPPGMFLEIYRTKVYTDTPGPYYLVYQMPVPAKQGQVASVYDNKADTLLIENYEDQDPGYELPRACKYLTGWQNQLAQAGYPADPTLKNERYPSVSDPIVSTSLYGQPAFDIYTYYTDSFLCDFQSVYWSDSLAPEGFLQDGSHEFSIDTKFADRVTAIAPNKDALFALKERSTAVLTGSVAENDVVMEVLESDAGCSSHRSVEDVRGSLVWLDGVNGFYSCVAGRLPENIGFPIQDYQKINAQKLDYSKATAANFRKESLYVCSVGTTTFVFDYADNGSLKRNCWYIWDGFSGKSVISTSDNKLLIWDGIRTLKMKLTLTEYDFTDHKSAISMVLNTAWLNQGHPTIDKHYVGLWINSIQGNFTLTVKQYGNFLEDLIGTQTNVQFIPETSAKKFIKAQVKASLPKLSSISFGVENAEKNKWVRIQGYEVQYSLDFAAGEPKR